MGMACNSKTQPKVHILELVFDPLSEKKLKGPNIKLHPMYIQGQTTDWTGTGVQEYDIQERSDIDEGLLCCGREISSLVESKVSPNMYVTKKDLFDCVFYSAL
jgi:hypothetical protein